MGKSHDAIYCRNACNGVIARFIYIFLHYDGEKCFYDTRKKGEKLFSLNWRIITGKVLLCMKTSYDHRPSVTDSPRKRTIDLFKLRFVGEFRVEPSYKAKNLVEELSLSLSIPPV